MQLGTDDGNIKRVIELKGLDFIAFRKECARVEGKITKCENGKRVRIYKQFEEPLPIFMKFKDCQIDWKCRFCDSYGHKEIACP